MCGNSTIPCGCGCKDKPTNISIMGLGTLFDSPSLRALARSPQLGMVASSKRAIKPGTEYNQYFNLGELTNKEVPKMKGDQKDTLALMEKLVKRYQYQTARLAPKLKGSTLINTLSNIFDFMYGHIQYTLDKDGVEQLRTPLRTWADRAHGVDCDCYSIFISSILHNLGIPHAFRMAKYSGDWQHVYVAVPKDGQKQSLQTRSNYYVVDPVKDRFNEEHPFTAKYDRFMKTPITVLSGLGSTGATCDKKAPTGYDLSYIPVSELKREGMQSTEEVLQAKGIPYQVLQDDKGQYAIALSDGAQTMKLPTIISDAQAAAIQKLSTEGETQISEDGTKKAGMGSGWLWALLATGVGVWLLWDAKPQPTGLEGLPKSSKKTPKRTKRKAAAKTPVIVM